ncbi:hypothetical protein GCM10009799_38750 [Nocardiopsis rhodophaea]|uniref:Uncharacterized protein n=1 Tax=Nocardiopsis rhodophaea TaxID=280238 RepID=A0ABN2TF25_9ACTN
MEDPEFADHLERCAERIPEADPAMDPSAPLPVPMMLWAAIAAIALALILALVMGSTGESAPDPAEGGPPTSSDVSVYDLRPGVVAGQE